MPAHTVVVGAAVAGAVDVRGAVVTGVMDVSITHGVDVEDVVVDVAYAKMVVMVVAAAAVDMSLQGWVVVLVAAAEVVVISSQGSVDGAVAIEADVHSSSHGSVMVDAAADAAEEDVVQLMSSHGSVEIVAGAAVHVVVVGVAGAVDSSSHGAVIAAAELLDDDHADPIGDAEAVVEEVFQPFTHGALVFAAMATVTVTWTVVVLVQTLKAHSVALLLAAGLITYGAEDVLLYGEGKPLEGAANDGVAPEPLDVAAAAVAFEPDVALLVWATSAEGKKCGSRSWLALRVCMSARSWRSRMVSIPCYKTFSHQVFMCPPSPSRGQCLTSLYCGAAVPVLQRSARAPSSCCLCIIPCLE